LKIAGDFELWARFMMKADLYVVPVPFGIYRVQGSNKAMVDRNGYRDECVKVLNRYSPIIPQDLERLNQRVTSKKLAGRRAESFAARESTGIDQGGLFQSCRATLYGGRTHLVFRSRIPVNTLT